MCIVHLIIRLAGLLLTTGLSLPAIADVPPSLAERDHELIEHQLATMPTQRPGHPDLFVIGVAGDGHEPAFSNEVEYLRELATTRLDANGRMIALVNRPDRQHPPGSIAPPRATLDNLRLALNGISQKMDPEQDLLLLYMASHGSEDYRFALTDHHGLDESIRPTGLRQVLDEAGIGYRIVVVSACFSGGFIPALRTPDTLLLTAADHDRTSFGCGASSTFTWFGRALLMEGFQHSQNPITAFQYARKTVQRRENKFRYPASRPQMDIGDSIRAHIGNWQATLPEMPAAPEWLEEP